jgi:hypothetical protein
LAFSAAALIAASVFTAVSSNTFVPDGAVRDP